MRKVFSFYFDGTIVQVVQACFSDAKLTVQSAQTFHHHELDDFLADCKGKNFIVSWNPPSFQQDIVHLPPAAIKQYDKLVRTEIKKLHPELTAFSAVYDTVGQTTIDNRVYNKIAAFSYADAPQRAILSAFSARGLTISRSYSTPCSVFRLIAGDCGRSEQARLFIASLPAEKLLLLSMDHKLAFIRKLPSQESTLVAADVQSINMTLDYCFQALRVKPAEAVLLEKSAAVEQTTALFVPLSLCSPPSLTNVPDHLIAEYLGPLAAALHYFESPRLCNLLPAEYVSWARGRRLLAAGSGAMIVLALTLLAYTSTQWRAMAKLKTDIALSRSHLANSAAEIAAFKKLDAETKALSLPLEIVQKQSRSLHPAAALACLQLSASNEYLLKGVSAREEAGTLKIQIAGEVNASGFANVQESFERITRQVSGIPGYTVLSSTLDIAQKTFTIQAAYHGTGRNR